MSNVRKTMHGQHPIQILVFNKYIYPQVSGASRKQWENKVYSKPHSNRITTPEFVEQPTLKLPALKKETIPAPITPARRPSTPIAKTATPLLNLKTSTPKSVTPIAKSATPINKPATPVAKPVTTSSSRLSLHSEIENIPEDGAVKPEVEIIHRVHTPQVIEDLGYDSPKPMLKHPNLSSLEVS